jgi:protein SCO1/2
MSLSGRSRMLLGFVLANLAMATVAAVVFITRPVSPPHIQGVLLAQANPLPAFSLLDHRGKPFSNKQLQGRWHLVSYGFTTCPDICPTTLSQLAVVVSRLGDRAKDLDVLFYTVDHRRDTVDQLAAYLPFFDERFIGLTHLDNPDNPHLPFEQGLGVAARLVPGEDPGAGDYQVIHGLTLFLLNPQGQLQAIFEPDASRTGAGSFNPDTVVADYLAIRQYLAKG